ncbi:MAG: DUF2809 domain-containing protein [Algibacter sp.]
MKLKFNDLYFVLFIVLLYIEIAIAICLKTGFIRHTFGDFLSTILLYTFFKSFLKVNTIKLGISVLVFAFIIEFGQLINILEVFGLENNHVVKIIFGSTFQFSDLVAYTLGIATVLIIETRPVRFLKPDRSEKTKL